MNPSVETANDEPEAPKRGRPPKIKKVRRNYAAEVTDLEARIRYALFAVRAIQRAANVKDDKEIINLAQQATEILTAETA